MPQAPLTSGPIIMRPGTKPPATGWPLSGATTNQATSVGKIAPNSSAAIQYPAPRGNLGSTQEKTKPQTPPQRASEITFGTPNGSVGAIGNGGAGIRPAAGRTAKRASGEISGRSYEGRGGRGGMRDGGARRTPEH